MPTISYYPAAYAAEAARNLRALAASGNLPATGVGTSPVIAELRDAARAMRQVLDQLATARAGHGDPAALAAADDLHQAGTALDAVATGLTRAAQAARVAAAPDRSAMTAPAPAATEAAEPTRHEWPTRRSRRDQAQRSTASEPDRSWFAPRTLRSGADRGRGRGL
ncbi:hypothetical protein J4H92_14550 [Leucobacter weissii]|uniref:Uncharacterized protein n=1 Tax=Leucobacter weissii TaxID=1983706 RepID=A0A939S9H6_9MICO|nr:hypothetical protein [Leucobacter weissii]MBO1903161.1 hypothetical protein [Leucobacter weissii]